MPDKSNQGDLGSSFVFYPQNNEKPLKNFKQENHHHIVLLCDHSMQRMDYKRCVDKWKPATSSCCQSKRV